MPLVDRNDEPYESDFITWRREDKPIVDFDIRAAKDGDEVLVSSTLVLLTTLCCRPVSGAIVKYLEEQGYILPMK